MEYQEYEQPSQQWTVEQISDSGERVTHLHPNDCYFAHLSLYYFATRFCQNGMVLDAGSGAGYGSAYLAKHGARFVYGTDLSDKAIAFSQHYFNLPNLEYRAMTLEAITGFSPQTFDCIFSSNTLEHVPDVTRFFRLACGLIKPEGVLIIVVPPITRDVDWEVNIANRYHLNIWTPRQWYHMLSLFFSNIQPYWHGFNKPGVPLDFLNTPEQAVINEMDFIFKPISLDEYYSNPSLGVIFVVSDPISESRLPPKNLQVEFVDNSFTRSPFTPEENLNPPNWQHPFSMFKYLFKRSIDVFHEDGFIEMIQRAHLYVYRKIS